MPTAGSILFNVRSLYGDPDGDAFSDAVGLDWLNRAQRRFCHRVLPLDEYQDFSIVEDRNWFNVNDDCIIPTDLMWYKSTTRELHYVTPGQWKKSEEAHPNSTGTPEIYTFYRRQIIVGPQIPSTSSATSTASGAIHSTVTTLGLSDASGIFRSRGYVRINSEVIEYTGVATTTLTGCTRGVHNTTAASHASADVVTQIDLVMQYRKTPAVIAATGTSPEVPTWAHDYLEKYVGYLAWLARGDSAKADRAFAEFERYEADAIRTIGRRTLDGMQAIKSKVRGVGRWSR